MRSVRRHVDGDLGAAASYHVVWRVALQWSTARLIAAGTLADLISATFPGIHQPHSDWTSQ